MVGEVVCGSVGVGEKGGELTAAHQNSCPPRRLAPTPPAPHPLTHLVKFWPRQCEVAPWMPFPFCGTNASTVVVYSAPANFSLLLLMPCRGCGAGRSAQCGAVQIRQAVRKCGGDRHGTHNAAAHPSHCISKQASRFLPRPIQPLCTGTAHTHLGDGHRQQLLVHAAVQVQHLVHLCDGGRYGGWRYGWGRCGTQGRQNMIEASVQREECTRAWHPATPPTGPTALPLTPTRTPGHSPASASALVAKQVWPSCHRNSRELQGASRKGRQAGSRQEVVVVRVETDGVAGPRSLAAV